MPQGGNRFFAKHAKSSAMLISLVIHAIIFVVAITFVAVTVVEKKKTDFVAKEVSRPKMPLKKLQVPVNVTKKQVKKPKLNKRIVVKTPKTHVPDIKMPEISGVKGGIGGMGAAGLGGTGGIGFTMPEINVFGVKSKGEKVFIILDSSGEMMYDVMGGIPAYTIIKQELVRIIKSLPPTTLFNVAVFEGNNFTTLFPKMVTASNDNTDQLQSWLEPLNAVTAQMGSKDYGLKTLGKGGERQTENLVAGGRSKITNHASWVKASAYAMKHQADAIYVLTSWWQLHRHTESEAKPWSESARKRWEDSHKKGLELLDKENKERAARGEPPKVLNRDSYSINNEYFKDIERPPSAVYYHYSPREIAEEFMMIREKHRSASDDMTAGVGRKRSKVDFSFNVIRFQPANGEDTFSWAKSDENFKKLTSMCRGSYNQVNGLEAIKSYVSAPKEAPGGD